jgi:hypothetical protein
MPCTGSRGQRVKNVAAVVEGDAFDSIGDPSSFDARLKLDDGISSLDGNPLRTDAISREREYRPEIVLDRVARAWPRGMTTALFVPQGLNGIKTRGPDGGHHAADEPYRTEDERGHDQSTRSNNQADIATLRVLRYRAVQSKPSDRERDPVGKDDSQSAAREGDGERLRQELKQDVPPTRAQRLFDSNYAAMTPFMGAYNESSEKP